MIDLDEPGDDPLAELGSERRWHRRAWLVLRAVGKRTADRQADILLTAAYFLVATPLALVARITGSLPLEEAPLRSRGSAWYDRDGTSRLSRRLT